MIREENRLYYTLLYKPCWVQGLVSMSRELQGREAEIFLKLNHEVTNTCMSTSTGKYVLKTYLSPCRLFIIFSIPLTRVSACNPEFDA